MTKIEELEERIHEKIIVACMITFIITSVIIAILTSMNYVHKNDVLSQNPCEAGLMEWEEKYMPEAENDLCKIECMETIPPNKGFEFSECADWCNDKYPDMVLVHKSCPSDTKYWVMKE